MSLLNLHNTPCRLYISEVRSLKEIASTRTFCLCRFPNSWNFQLFGNLQRQKVLKLSTCFWNLHRIRKFYEGDTMVAKIPLCPLKSQNRLSPSCLFASLSKRVYMQDHSNENAFHIWVHFHASQTHFLTITRFETEAKGWKGILSNYCV